MNEDIASKNIVPPPVHQIPLPPAQPLPMMPNYNYSPYGQTNPLQGGGGSYYPFQQPPPNYWPTDWACVSTPINIAGVPWWIFCIGLLIVMIIGFYHFKPKWLTVESAGEIRMENQHIVIASTCIAVAIFIFPYAVRWWTCNQAKSLVPLYYNQMLQQHMPRYGNMY